MKTLYVGDQFDLSMLNRDRQSLPTWGGYTEKNIKQTFPRFPRPVDDPEAFISQGCFEEVIGAANDFADLENVQIGDDDAVLIWSRNGWWTI